MSKSTLNLIILFVEDPLKSGPFYSQVLEIQPVEQSSTFVLFALPNGIQLGLWSLKTAEPRATKANGSCEICFAEEKVDACFERLQRMNIPLAQVPTDMDFGRSFVALDPDRHRVRFYHLWEQ